jgi:hypothetical protein
MSTAQASLFATCPACRRNPVPDPREPCAECAAAFGPMLRRGDRQVSAEEFAAEVAEGDQSVAAVLAERRRMFETAAATAGED